MIHTPKESVTALKALNDNCTIEFIDSSYKNDCSDSASFEKNDWLLVVMFPNIWDGSEIEQSEQYNSFTVYFQNPDGDKEYLINQTGEELLTFEETIKVVNDFNASQIDV